MASRQEQQERARAALLAAGRARAEAERWTPVQVPNGYKAVLVSDQLIERLADWSKPATVRVKVPPPVGALADPQFEYDFRMQNLLRKFANHRAECGCFICRNLDDDERAFLAEVLADGL
jgi:hypothetical protein